MHNLFLVYLKAVPLQAWVGPEGSRKLRFPDFLTTAQDIGKVSLTHRPPLPPGRLLVLISFRGYFDPRTIVQSEGLCQWKIPMTTSGIEPATFRFVAQYLNDCATAVHLSIFVFSIFINFYMFRAIMCPSSGEMKFHPAYQDSHPHRIASTKWRIKTVVSPDDRHIVALNM
jgi:hypothetical protein